MITSPQLFAGILKPIGDEYCFYCGGICGQENPVSKHVKDTFTNRDIVRRPASGFICSGCVCTLNERADINLANEEMRKAQKTRLYSWIFSSSERVAYTKAHLKKITEIILYPPEPPFGIVLATSGQKQLLFRSVLAWNRTRFPVMLEEEIIMVYTDELASKMHLASVVIAAIGKPSLSEMESNHAIRYFDYYKNLDSFRLWKKEMNNPINRLALYLSPSQKESQIEHPRIECANTGKLPSQVGLFE